MSCGFGRRCRRFAFPARRSASSLVRRRTRESRSEAELPCHSDHMKIIRTFSYLEKRSDYLFYLSIPISIARNENSRYHGLLTMVSAFVLLKKTYFYDIINTSKNFQKIFGKPIDSPLNCNDILCLQDRNSAVSILQNLNERKTLCIR